MKGRTHRASGGGISPEDLKASYAKSSAEAAKQTPDERFANATKGLKQDGELLNRLGQKRGGKVRGDRERPRLDKRARGGGIYIKPSHRGLLHKELGVPQGQKIPQAKLEAAKHSSNPAERKRATFAENFGHARGGKLMPDARADDVKDRGKVRFAAARKD